MFGMMRVTNRPSLLSIKSLSGLCRFSVAVIDVHLEPQSELFQWKFLSCSIFLSTCPLMITVVKRSYSRPTFRSFLVTPSHSFSWHKSLKFQRKVYETHVSIEGDELAPIKSRLRHHEMLLLQLEWAFLCSSTSRRLPTAHRVSGKQSGPADLGQLPLFAMLLNCTPVERFF